MMCSKRAHVSFGTAFAFLHELLLFNSIMKDSKIEITGKVAEMIEDHGKRHIRIVCDSKNLIVSIDHMGDIQLGDELLVKGKFKIKTIEVNGIKINES